MDNILLFIGFLFELKIINIIQLHAKHPTQAV